MISFLKLPLYSPIKPPWHFFQSFISFDYFMYLTYKRIEHLQYIQNTYFFKLYFNWLFCVWHWNIQRWKIQSLYSIFSQLKKIKTSKSTIQHSAIKGMKKGCPRVFVKSRRDYLFQSMGIFLEKMQNWYYILAWS